MPEWRIHVDVVSLTMVRQAAPAPPVLPRARATPARPSCSARDASSMGEGHVDGEGHAQGPRVHAAERANQLWIVVEVLKAALGVVVVADMR